MLTALIALLADEEPYTDEECHKINTTLGASLVTLTYDGHVLRQYAPDGSYVESNSYWAYGTTNLMNTMAALYDSLGTDLGKNLLKPGKNPAENKQFLLFLAAVIKAVDEYQELFRISAASPGNDCRLGGSEAPPTIMSIFLGEELDGVIDSVIGGEKYEKSGAKYMSLGVSAMPSIRRDATDRNRTSPFAFTGHKFEFRMVGASQNIALIKREKIHI